MSTRQASMCRILAFVVLVLPIVPTASVVHAQQGPPPGDNVQRLAAVGNRLMQQLPSQTQSALSAGAQTLLTIAGRAQALQQAHPQPLSRAATTARALPQVPEEAAPPRVVRRGLANDPDEPEDFLSRLGGMTQSETSVGWCGTNTVIGFNDTGSLSATLFGSPSPSPSGSLSGNGWSLSTDAGRTFVDQGALVADPLPAGVRFRNLFGDPVVRCTSPSTFYYASLAMDVLTTGASTSGVSVSRSQDGGHSWGGAVMAAQKDALTHMLDKPWLAVSPSADPTSAARPQPGPPSGPGGSNDILHVTYTDFDTSGTTASCGPNVRIAIEYVRSTDGGTTWSSPLVIDEVCFPTAIVQGSQVAVGLGGDVYVAWERFPNAFNPGVPPRDIRLRKSTDAGATFAAARVVAAVTPVGDGFLLQGRFRAGPDLQGLAVDRSTGANRGAVYLTWHDGRALQQTDPLAVGCTAPATYCFGDIRVTRSSDGGATWSEPVRVNNDQIGLAVDQFQPALDIDREGTVAVLYYDRRRDPRNFLIDAFLAESTDGGRTWTNTRVSGRQFAPVTGWEDSFTNPAYMGDYIGIAADTTQTNAGLIASWGDNSLGDANVMFAKRE